MSHCPNFKGVLVAIDNNGEKIAVVPRCKSWYCSYCAKKNRERWGAVLLNHVNRSENKDWCWATLTAHEKAHRYGAKYTLKNISRAWDRLSKRMKRKYGKFEYCRVYEKHKSGNYHMHFIRSGRWDDLVTRNRGRKNEYNDSPWLRKNARNLGLGFMTHGDNIEGKKRGLVAFYVLKYMTKLEDVDKEEWRGVRRIQTSRGIRYTNLQESEYNWYLKSGLYERDLVDGVYLVNENRLLSDEDFTDSRVYPP